MSQLEEAVTTVIERCLRLRVAETVLVVADPDIAPCLPSPSRNSARKRACELGHRGATLPGVTADMLRG